MQTNTSILLKVHVEISYKKAAAMIVELKVNIFLIYIMLNLFVV